MISIIIPLFNKQSHIQHAIRSVLSQDYKNFEIVVIDDGSTDQSANRVLEMGTDKIYLISKSNGGPASARNLGVKHSNGDWIMFLDADDYLEPDALKHFAKLINKYPNCHFFCANHYIEKNGQKTLFSNSYVDGYVRNSFYAWCTNNFMPRAGAALFSKEILVKNPMREDLRRYEDAEHLFKIMRFTKVVQSSVPVMTYNCENAEASTPRKNIAEDFIGHLNPKGKSWWEHYAIYQLYILGCRWYPEDMKRLYKQSDFWDWKVKVTNRYLKYMKKMRFIK